MIREWHEVNVNAPGNNNIPRQIFGETDEIE